MVGLIRVSASVSPAFKFADALGTAPACFIPSVFQTALNTEYGRLLRAARLTRAFAHRFLLLPQERRVNVGALEFLAEPDIKRFSLAGLANRSRECGQIVFHFCFIERQFGFHVNDETAFAHGTER